MRRQRHRRKAVVENRYVILSLGEFGRKFRIDGGSQWVVLRGRHERPPLTMTGVSNPLTPQGMPT
jgi:hypothetical protein